jgi:hypothetical protein
MRILPEAVTGDPTDAVTVVDCPAGVLVLGGSPQAASRKAMAASAKRDWRIGSILRRTAADGRERTVTS